MQHGWAVLHHKAAADIWQLVSRPAYVLQCSTAACGSGTPHGCQCGAPPEWLDRTAEPQHKFFRAAEPEVKSSLDELIQMTAALSITVLALRLAVVAVVCLRTAAALDLHPSLRSDVHTEQSARDLASRGLSPQLLTAETANVTVSAAQTLHVRVQWYNYSPNGMPNPCTTATEIPPPAGRQILALDQCVPSPVQDYFLRYSCDRVGGPVTETGCFKDPTCGKMPSTRPCVSVFVKEGSCGGLPWRKNPDGSCCEIAMRQLFCERSNIAVGGLISDVINRDDISILLASPKPVPSVPPLARPPVMFKLPGDLISIIGGPRRAQDEAAGDGGEAE